MKPSRVPFVTLIIVLVFFYLPIGFLVMYSFNNSRYASTWSGFSTRWYERLFERTDILAALGNSVKIATAASLLSMILGTSAAFALHRYKSKLQDAHRLLVTVPLVLPDILMGMSLLLLFVTVGMSLSLVTITVAHVTFCLSYVALVVQARLQDFDFNVVEAAHDLGAAAYAIKAARASVPTEQSEAAGRLECRWQRAQLPDAIRELVLDDQRLRNDLCWSVFDC